MEGFDEKSYIVGILAIILGLIVLAFPLAGLVAASVLTGFVILNDSYLASDCRWISVRD
jgi:hypothetical protein